MTIEGVKFDIKSKTNLLGKQKNSAQLGTGKHKHRHFEKAAVDVLTLAEVHFLCLKLGGKQIN